MPDFNRGSKLQIVLADDHALLRSAWKSLINSQPDMEVVGEADNGRTAIEAAILLRPACIVMDASMPEMDGVAATKWLATSLPEVTVVALTGHQDQGLLWQFLSAGAAGYVLKHSDPQHLLQAIRTVSFGGMFIDAGMSSNRYRNVIVAEGSASRA